ncbi:GNAT family N-acetyltransferase [Fulvimarina manganoxydans]|uniref:GNAT family N-acetyltransferase n=1 Tax=Fulvimarina manganoxydans TaxID=937218 RepID=UPI002352B716|nr:GNAT family N-acetyltransferase [Fulvimarina manganoxydans]
MADRQGTSTIERLTGEAILPVLDEVARLRISVFAAFPYLYAGDAAYERRYLETYVASPGAVVVVARAPSGEIVGASTAAPLADHQPQLADSFAKNDIDPAAVFYCAESVLLPDWRGYGIGHRFFEEREAAAREQGFSLVAFCAVIRPPDHPARPKDYSPLDPFWKKRGYAKMDAIHAPMSWRDIGESEESEKDMQFWVKRLAG